MKIALIGQDIPALLPSLLADAYFACKWPVELAIEERQDALGDLLGRYADAVLRQSGVEGRILVTASRGEALRGADAVVYAGDYLAASRFRMDREALLGDEDDPGLSDQARVNGGLGGLMHTLRQGELLRQLCDAMEEACPNAVVVTMGQPVGRTAAILEKRGHRAWGLGPSPFKGPGGVEDIARRLGRKTQEVNAVTAGLPGFAFLTELRDQRGKDLLPAARELAERGELGRLTQRWLARWDALAVGFAVVAALFPLPHFVLPAQSLLLILVSMLLSGHLDFRSWSRPALLLCEATLLSGGVASICLSGTRTQAGGVLCAVSGALLTALTCAVRRTTRWQVHVLLRSPAGTVRFTALVDTGNRLREPISGLPVLIAEAKLVRNVLPEDGYRILSFGSVGGSGRMACFKPSGVWIERGRHRTRAPDVWVAVSAHPLPGAYHALAPCEFAYYAN